MQVRNTAKAIQREKTPESPVSAVFQEKLRQILLSNRDYILETGEDPVRFLGYIPPLFEVDTKFPQKRTLIIARSDVEVREISDYARLIQPRKGSPGPVFSVIGGERLSRIISRGNGGDSEILLGTPEHIIDFLRRGSLDIKDIRRVIIDCPEVNDFSGFAANVEFIYSRTGIKPQSVVLTGELHPEAEGLSYLLKRPRIIPQNKFLKTQEIDTVSSENNRESKDDPALKDLIASIIRKVKSEENPRDLNYFKKQIRRNVSLFDRSYFAAYLLKRLYEEPGTGKSRGGSREKSPQQLDMTTLFFGLGKNRKVFPRDITGLISGVPRIEKGHIGEIKILDNYSFVEIADFQAKRVIDALNGVDFRGRKVIVNFARKKDDQGDASPQGAIG